MRYGDHNYSVGLDAVDKTERKSLDLTLTMSTVNCGEAIRR